MCGLLAKEFSLCDNPDVFATRCRRLLIFQTMISIRFNNLELKYKRITPACCKYLKIRKCEIEAKIQFLRIVM